MPRLYKFVTTNIVNVSFFLHLCILFYIFFAKAMNFSKIFAYIQKTPAITGEILNKIFMLI